MRSHRQDSFKTFEANTSDAWDDGDDDLMKLASAARQKLSKKNMQSVCVAPSGDEAKPAAGNNNCASVSELSTPFVSSSGIHHRILL